MWGPKPIPGTDYEARPISMAEMGEAMSCDNDVRTAAMLAYFGTYDGDARVWASVDDALNAPFPLVKAAAEMVGEVNNPSAEQAEGN